MSGSFPQSWVADFHLVNPATLASTRSVTQATVRAHMQGLPSNLDGKSDRDRYRTVGSTLRGMAHGAAARRKLEEGASIKGAQQFFFCSRCGEKLMPSGCQRCEIKFVPEISQLVARTAPPVIPAKVAAYAANHDTGFQKFVLRPRRP